MSDKVPVELWVDGSVYPVNPGRGGWGAVLVFDGKKARTTLRCSGLIPGNRTTNNQAETLAVKHALDKLRKPCAVTVYTDSTYVIKGMQRVAEGTTLPSNAAQWQELAAALETGKHDVADVVHVRRNGKPYHKEAHNLAKDASRDEICVAGDRTEIAK